MILFNISCLDKIKNIDIIGTITIVYVLRTYTMVIVR